MSTFYVGDVVTFTCRVKQAGRYSGHPVTAHVSTRAGSRTYTPGAGIDCDPASGICTLSLPLEMQGELVVHFTGGGANHTERHMVEPASAKPAAIGVPLSQHYAGARPASLGDFLNSQSSDPDDDDARADSDEPTPDDIRRAGAELAWRSFPSESARTEAVRVQAANAARRRATARRRR